MANLNPVYSVSDTHLSAIADAIRSKTGLTASLSYPGGFIDALNALGSKPFTLEQVIERSGVAGSSRIVALTAVPSCYFESYKNVAMEEFPNCTYIGNSGFELCTTLTTMTFPICSYVGSSAFYSCYSLTTVSCPVCTYIGSYAFRYCSSLVSVSFPACSYIGDYAFQNCSNLTSITFPACSYLGSGVFSSCRSLTTISLPSCSLIGNSTFASCYNLLSIYLLGSFVASLNGGSVFISTPISNYTTSTGGIYGSIYVPASLLARYKAKTYWSVYSARIVGV